ncbi:MAG: GMC family oxidoreductase, partial [Thermoanaerobaculia bacterium]|nr:GMC family oxidoreductase [Thermoanaerobaculia bacterium]
ELARKFEKIMRGKAMAFGLTPLAGIPGTAHILGGAVMGDSPASGVIDRDNRVFGYDNLLVCDGAMISANPGVNPSLSITAIAELAMSKVPEKR